MIISLMWLGKDVTLNSEIKEKNFFLNKKIVFSLLLFAIISGIRSDVGVDYSSYLEYYKNISNEYSQYKEIELGFEFMSTLMANLKLHFSIYFGFIAMIQLLFVYYAFKDERYLYSFLIFVLITNGTYFMWMNGIRQCIVISIFIFAIRYIKERKFIKYLFWIFVGFLFHKSALLLIPLYFILVIEKDYFRSIWLQLVLIGLVFYISSEQIWQYVLSDIENVVSILGYSNIGDVEKQIMLRDKEFTKGIRFYFPILINIIIVLYSTKLKNIYKNTRIEIFYNLYFLGVLTSILFYNNSLMQRPFMYFIYLQYIICAYLLSYLWINIKYNTSYLFQFALLIFLHLGILYAYIASNHFTYFKFYWE